jgi:leucyl aminopeptidase
LSGVRDFAIVKSIFLFIIAKPGSRINIHANPVFFTRPETGYFPGRQTCFQQQANFKEEIMLKKLTLLLLASLSFTANATPDSESYFLITPSCLLKHVPITDYKTIVSDHSLSLVKTQSSNLQSFVDSKHLRHTTPCGGFMDVTEEWNASTLPAKQFLKKYDLRTNTLSAAKYDIHHPDQVNPLLDQLNSQELWSDLIAFSDTRPDQFPDRYSNSPSGIKAAIWLQNKITAMAQEAHRNDVSITTISTGIRYKQPSVVIKIGRSSLPGIVIGAHMDTYQQSAKSGTKPGADDDGSGAMTVMAIARTLISSGVSFKKPIFIIWYSAEEWGLVGSKFVVNHFMKTKIPVEAVLQFDMTGYTTQNDPALWLVTDFVNPDLTTFVTKLIETYVKKPVRKTKCGYACSDHASWTKAGIKSAFPFEAEFGSDNPYIHQSSDTIDRLSLDHMMDYAKLGLAFAVELAEPV